MGLFTRFIATNLLVTSFASFGAITTESRLFDVGMDNILNQISDASESIRDAATCSTELASLYHVLYNFSSKDVDLTKLSNDELKRLSQKSFNTRLKLKENLKHLNTQQTSAKSCLKNSKEIVKALRYVEDYFIEYLYSRTGKNKDEYVTLTGEGVHFLKNDQFYMNSYDDLKKGDILISRGNAFTSAAIARIGQDDYQFSHMTLIHRDNENQLHTSEAHIEIGSVVAPLQIHLDQKNARTVVFRHADAKLAAAATDYTYNHIKDFKAKRGFNIEYDFGMNLESDVRLFCSEVAYVGYLHAAKELYNQELKMPLYKTKFNKGHLRFLKQVGIEVNEENIDTFSTFGPGDIQFDPRFEIVAEWRNPEKLSDSRFKDAILTKVFEWMEEENYYFKTRLLDKVQNNLAWFLRKNKWIASLTGLNKQFPLNMKVRQINLFITLDILGEALYTELAKHQAKSETPLTFKELYEILETFRQEDLARFNKERKSSKFHKSFRPKK